MSKYFARGDTWTASNLTYIQTIKYSNFYNILFTIASKKTKYLHAILTQERQDQYTENSNIMLRENKDLSKWKDNHNQCIRR